MHAVASGKAAAAHGPANVDVARLWADASKRADSASGQESPKDRAERDAAKPGGPAPDTSLAAAAPAASKPVRPAAGDPARDDVRPPQPPRIDTAGADDAINGAQAERPQTDTKARDRDDPQTTIDNPRRRAKRRPAGAAPPTNMATDLAANDDGPSIGGLLYALNRKPSNKPFYFAAVASAVWLISGILFGYLVLAPDIARVTSFADFVRESTFMTTLASVVGPVLLFWFLAFLAWRSEELHLRSTAMTEVAVRLAEPDRMAEEQVASLGQAVRRQVTFMNDAVNHALSRAGELEAMVQGEVTALERSYEDNEKKIRSLLQELAQERHSLTGTGEHFKGTLETLAKDVPLLIEQLSTQQSKLAGIIAGADENLTALEMSLAQQTGRLETTLDDRTQRLQSTLGDRAAELQTVLESYAEAISTTFQGRSEGLQVMLSDERAGFEQSLRSGHDGMQNLLADQRAGLEQTMNAGQDGMRSLLADQRSGLEQTINAGQDGMQNLLADQRQELEQTLTSQVTRLGTKLDDHRDAVETTLGGYTDALGTILHDRTAKIEQAIADHNAAVERHGHQIDSRLTARQADLGRMLEDHRANLEANLEQHNAAVERHGADIDSRLTARQADLGRMLEDHRAGLEANLDQQTGAIDDIITKRTEFLQSVFDEYALALDTTLANRANALDTQLVERTKALDEAFTDRLRLFDESIVRSTQAIDDAVGENAKSLTTAMEAHAESLSDMIRTQSVELDETLVRGIGAVRESSENISRQSIRAIEGLATQAEMLKTVSENLLGQINSVTNRFENQGHAILRSANALEGANYKIDKALGERAEQLNRTLDRLSSTASELGQMVDGYSSTLEGSVSDAQERTRLLTQELSREAEERKKTAIDEVSRLKSEALAEKDRALEELKAEFRTVTREVTDRLGVLSQQFSQTSGEVRARARQATDEIRADQERLKSEIERLPAATQESATAMRRALGDQLRALDQLSALANKFGVARDVRAPVNPPASDASEHAQLVAGTDDAGKQQQRPRAAAAPAAEKPDGDAEQRTFSSLTSTLARELNQRASRVPPEVRDAAPPTNATPAAAPNPQAAAPTPQAAPAARQPARSEGVDGERWSFGDLLARASQDDGDADSAGDDASPPANAGGGFGNLDIPGIAAAIDANLAAAIWSRFRAGQRGFMVRSIYPHTSRELFDETQGRYTTDATFQDNVDQFLNDYEALLKDCDARDRSGQAAHDKIVSETGRVYLFLAHASGRLA